MNTQRKFLRPSLLVIVCLLIFGNAALVWADDWKLYTSTTGVFKVKLPPETKSTLNSLRISPKLVVHSEDAVAVIDQRAFKKDALKSYVVHIDQTVGPTLTNEEATHLIEKELDTYITHYRGRGGEVKKRSTDIYYNNLGGEVYITYNDKNLGPQGMRARVIFTDLSKIQQVIVGPDYIMFSQQTKDFFDSLYLTEGISRIDGSFKDEWIKHESPLRLFETKLPTPTKPFITKDAKFNAKAKTEVMNFVVNDPVRNEKIFYNVYGYKLDRTLTYSDVQKELLGRHIVRHLKIPRVRFNKNKNAKYPMMETIYQIPAPKNYSYLKMVTLRATFVKDYLIVQEILASRSLVQSPLVSNLLTYTTFTPEAAHKAFIAKGLATDEPIPTQGAAEGAPLPDTSAETPADAAPEAPDTPLEPGEPAAPVAPTTSLPKMNMPDFVKNKTMLPKPTTPVVAPASKTEGSAPATTP